MVGTIRDRMNRLPSIPEPIVDCLRRAGRTARVVGGAVRDSLCGIECITDWDLGAALLPEDLAQRFPDAIESDLRLGVVSGETEGLSWTVAAYREDGEYADHRHPDVVSFVDSVARDAERRDFTINAIYADESGAIEDPVGGRDDLGARTLRMIGDPHRRLAEDPLRIWRGVRFVTRLGLTIEPELASAIRRHAGLAAEVPAARRFDEIDGSLGGGGAWLTHVERLGLRAAACGEGVAFSADAEQRLDLVREDSAVVRWAVLLQGAEDPRATLREFGAPRAVTRDVDSILRGVDALRNVADLGPAARRAVLQSPTLGHQLRLLRVEERVRPGSVSNLDVITSVCDAGVQPPLLSGDDVMARGVEPGPRVGEILAEVDRRLDAAADRARALRELDAVLAGSVKPPNPPADSPPR